MFITLEGPEGAGKSTQLIFLLENLRHRGLDVISVREPGGTPTGDRIRALLLDRHSQIEPAAEMLLYSASRAQLVTQVIRPHLARGGVVLCDRFADSTLAYQGYGRGLDLTALRLVTTFATGGLNPDLTVFLDIEPQLGLARRTASGSALDRLDAETLDFHQRVRDGYLALMAAEPARWVRVDADQPLAVVQGMILALIEERLTARGALR